MGASHQACGAARTMKGWRRRWRRAESRGSHGEPPVSWIGLYTMYGEIPYLTRAARGENPYPALAHRAHAVYSRVLAVYRFARKETRMNIEQFARDFITEMDDPQTTRSRLTPDATVSGGILPQTLPASQAIDI